MKKLKIEHKKGKRFSTLSSILGMLNLILFIRPKYIHLYFPVNAIYSLPGNEQADWNKVGGKGSLAYRFKNKGNKRAGHKHERLISWRYFKNTFQYCYYSRNNYQFEWMGVENLKPDTVSPPIEFRNWLKGIKPLFSNFGGTLPAPKNFSYYIMFE